MAYLEEDVNQLKQDVGYLKNLVRELIEKGAPSQNEK